MYIQFQASFPQVMGCNHQSDFIHYGGMLWDSMGCYGMLCDALCIFISSHIQPISDTFSWNLRFKT